MRQLYRDLKSRTMIIYEAATKGRPGYYSRIVLSLMAIALTYIIFYILKHL